MSIKITAKRGISKIQINAGCQAGELTPDEAKDLITKVQAALDTPASQPQFWLQTTPWADGIARWYGPYTALVRGDYAAQKDVWVTTHQDGSKGWFISETVFTGITHTKPEGM